MYDALLAANSKTLPSNNQIITVELGDEQFNTLVEFSTMYCSGVALMTAGSVWCIKGLGEKIQLYG